jgi:hypothetical protein
MIVDSKIGVTLGTLPLREYGGEKDGPVAEEPLSVLQMPWTEAQWPYRQVKRQPRLTSAAGVTFAFVTHIVATLERSMDLPGGLSPVDEGRHPTFDIHRAADQ